MLKAAAYLILAGALATQAQTPNYKVELPKDSPLVLVSDDWGASSAAPRGGAFVIDLDASLSFRNTGARRVRSVTLSVLAQELTPGGKGSVAVPSLDVIPGDTFPVRIDLHLLRPLGGGGPQIVVALDGVLFDDLSFYGPDKLNSRRTMTVWEMEARRDRKYFKSVLAQAGAEGLRNEMLASLDRQADRPQYGVQVMRGRSTNADPERQVQFAFLHLPDAPVDPTGGLARVAGNEVRAPRVDVQSRSERTIRHLEIGWIVEDQSGRKFLAGSVPADLNLAPKGSTEVLEDAALRFPDVKALHGMTGFVSSVEFSDGSCWIPSRAALDDPLLKRVASPSPEEQRRARIYKTKGLDALVAELKKF